MFQVLSWRPRLCLCLRICNCHCLCICVTLPSLNSSCHRLSENVWVWGRGTVRSADFNLWAKCRGWWVGGGGGGRDKCTSWSDLVGVRQKSAELSLEFGAPVSKENVRWELIPYSEQLWNLGLTPPVIYCQTLNHQSQKAMISSSEEFYVFCGFQKEKFSIGNVSAW